MLNYNNLHCCKSVPLVIVATSCHCDPVLDTGEAIYEIAMGFLATLGLPRRYRSSQRFRRIATPSARNDRGRSRKFKMIIDHSSQLPIISYQ
jgi:hypothetical protein